MGQEHTRAHLRESDAGIILETQGRPTVPTLSRAMARLRFVRRSYVFLELGGALAKAVAVPLADALV